MKYIDADKLRAEIVRRMDKHWEGLPDADSPEDDWTHNELCELGAYKELEHLETFLDTLEEPVSDCHDLKEAAEKYAEEQAFWWIRENPYNVILKRGNESHTIAEWSEIIGVNAQSLYERKYLGWDDERTLNTPVRTHKKKER